jgi:hypothetical protein
MQDHHHQHRTPFSFKLQTICFCDIFSLKIPAEGRRASSILKQGLIILIAR